MERAAAIIGDIGQLRGPKKTGLVKTIRYQVFFTEGETIISQK